MKIQHLLNYVLIGFFESVYLTCFLWYVVCAVFASGVINAGHSVKFTPHFELSSAEIAALADAFDGVCKTYPKTL